MRVEAAVAEDGDKAQAFRLGVMGGSFDPIHMGHLAIAEEAREVFSLEGIVFVPAAQPPHKDGGTVASGESRLAMAELAVSSNPHFEVSDVEMRRRGPSYTIDTLDEISRMRPEARVYFIVGADSLGELHTWHRADELAGRYDFIIIGRPGTDEVSLSDLEAGFTPEAAARLERNYIRAGIFHVSATGIRERVLHGKSIRYLVPPEVESYILKNGLYA